MSNNSSRGAEWEKKRQKVLARDNYTCAYCNQYGDTVDHILAKANGGTDDDWNLITACRKCNGKKQDKALVRLNYMNKRWLTRL